MLKCSLRKKHVNVLSLLFTENLLKGSIQTENSLSYSDKTDPRPRDSVRFIEDGAGSDEEVCCYLKCTTETRLTKYYLVFITLS